MTTFVPLDLAHAAVCAAVHGEAFEHPWDAAAFRDLLALPTSLGALAIEGAVEGTVGDGDPAGVILLQIVADEAEILTIGVRPAHRRTGLGRALIGWAGEALRQRGAARLFLDVSTANTAARALYTTSGFAEIAHRRRYYADGSDAVIMVLDL